jgi:6 kDa early secretory antigenic target
MTRYQVDADAVLAATHTARTTISRINSDVAMLSQSLQALQASWTGMASHAFQEVYSSWRVTQAQVETHLEQIAVALTTAATHYEEMEHANLALFRR